MTSLEGAAERYRLIVTETFATARDVWAPWAARHGVGLDPGDPSWGATRLPFIAGSIAGVALRIEVEMGMLEPTQVTRLIARPPSALPGRAALTRGHVSLVGKIFGVEDILIGDAPFDRAYVIKATAEASLRAWLTPAVRGAMLSLDIVSLRYDDGSAGGQPAVTLEFETQAASARTLDGLVELLLGVARARPRATAYR